MPTKMSLPPKPPKVLSRSKAWLYAALNQMAFPGAGTVMAGRPIGYCQATIMVLGFILTMLYFLVLITNIIRYATQNGGSEEELRALYGHYASAGKTGGVLCLFAWCWSLVSSIAFLRSSKREPPFLSPTTSRRSP